MIQASCTLLTNDWCTQIVHSEQIESGYVLFYGWKHIQNVQAPVPLSIKEPTCKLYRIEFINSNAHWKCSSTIAYLLTLIVLCVNVFNSVLEHYKSEFQVPTDARFRRTIPQYYAMNIAIYSKSKLPLCKHDIHFMNYLYM